MSSNSETAAKPPISKPEKPKKPDGSPDIHSGEKPARGRYTISR